MKRCRLEAIAATVFILGERFCSILTDTADKFDFYGLAIFSDVEIRLISCYGKPTIYSEQSQRHRDNAKKLSGGV
jgi:hypothetical protein